MLLSWANIWFYQELMREIRRAIADGRLAEFEAEYGARLNAVEQG